MPARKEPVPYEERISLRLEDAVTVTGLSRSTLYNLINSGKLPDCRVAGRRLILRSDLEALIRRGSSQPHDPRREKAALGRRLSRWV